MPPVYTCLCMSVCVHVDAYSVCAIYICVCMCMTLCVYVVCVFFICVCVWYLCVCVACLSVWCYGVCVCMCAVSPQEKYLTSIQQPLGIFQLRSSGRPWHLS